MGFGGFRFEARLVASAKLSSMEKYGFCYMSDVALIKDALYDEVTVFDDGSGTVRIARGCSEFAVKIRDYAQPAAEAAMVNDNGTKTIPGDPSRQGRFISVWDVKNH